MNLELKPPFKISNSPKYFKIFLAGTIDNGESEDWQKDFISKMSDVTQNTIYMNPRRDDCDINVEQKFEDPVFYQQVNWELNALESADVIIMNLLPGSKSPISLLELGLYAQSGKLLVCCPEGFYRKGNIDIVCDKYNIPLYENIDELISDNFM